jgi:hypothetical protein
MYITLVAVSKDFTITHNLGNVTAELIKTIAKNASSEIKILKYIDLYDNTFYNRDQLIQVRKEISYLKQLNLFSHQTETKIIEKSINLIEDNPNIYHYLWFIGD